MIGIIATLKAKSGQEQEFEAAAKKLVAAVNENEPGCLYYQLYRTGETGTYVMMERYENAAAVEAHRSSDHIKTLGRDMGPFMAGRPDITMLDLVE